MGAYYARPSGTCQWTLLAVPLPIFFAGLVSSTTFRREAQPASAFGANLLEATVGGFAEYLRMVVGWQRSMFVCFRVRLLQCSTGGTASSSNSNARFSARPPARAPVYLPILTTTS